MSELAMDLLRRLSFRTNAGCLELVYQEPWETSWGPEPEVLASVPLASLVTPPPAPQPERDPRTDPQVGDVLLRNGVTSWVVVSVGVRFLRLRAMDDPDWTTHWLRQEWHDEPAAQWFTREAWAARQKEKGK